MKKFTIVAGVNGAGKSTLYHLLLQITEDSVHCTGSFFAPENGPEGRGR